MKKDPSVLLHHILDSIAVIERVLPATEAEFSEDTDTQDIIIRRLEIIGEAAKHLPDDIKDLAPQVEWKRLLGLRNFLIHEYFNVDVDLLWRNVQDYLPILKQAITELVDTHSTDRQ